MYDVAALLGHRSAEWVARQRERRQGRRPSDTRRREGQQQLDTERNPRTIRRNM